MFKEFNAHVLESRLVEKPEVQQTRVTECLNGVLPSEIMDIFLKSSFWTLAFLGFDHFLTDSDLCLTFSWLIRRI